MPDELIDLTLSGLAYGGEAMGRDDAGRMVFVPFALPGERVSIQITEARKRWARGRLLKVLEPSSDRIQPRCRHFTICGGCHHQHMSYQDQLHAKTGIVAEQMRRIGGFEASPIEPATPSPDPWNYRNHMQLSLTGEGRLGFVEAEGRRVFAIEECHLPQPSLVDLWPRLELGAVPGLDRVALRAGADDDLLVILHGEGNPDVDLHIDLPISVVWLGPGGAAVLGGDGYLAARVSGRAYRVSAGSFFQVNDALAGELVARVHEFLDVQSGEVIFDLYAGVGLFSAGMAERGASVIAVEESPWAASDFEVNLHEFDTVTLYEAPVEQALPAIDEKPDAVLVDPPRSGLSREALDLIVEAGPERLVYVSCDPATMARDAKRLSAAGFKLIRVIPIDLFPQTFHIETISSWRR
jgi:23S rRNA (uracil1939-C5)-methyltransferase